MRVLIVDDDPAICRILGRLLGRAGAAVRMAEDVAGALGELGWDPDVAFIDLHLQGESGAALISEITRRGLTTQVVLMTGDTEAPVPRTAARLPKPFKIDAPARLLTKLLRPRPR